MTAGNIAPFDLDYARAEQRLITSGVCAEILAIICEGQLMDFPCARHLMVERP